MFPFKHSIDLLTVQYNHYLNIYIKKKGEKSASRQVNTYSLILNAEKSKHVCSIFQWDG